MRVFQMSQAAGNRTNRAILGNEYQVREKRAPVKIGKIRLKENWRWVAVVLVVITLFALMGVFHMRFNFTPSMPIGFYYQVAHSGQLKSGDIVQVCLPKMVGEQGLQSTNQYWLYGAHDPEYSWDSRFYGGVDRENIQGVIRPFITI